MLVTSRMKYLQLPAFSKVRYFIIQYVHMTKSYDVVRRTTNEGSGGSAVGIVVGVIVALLIIIAIIIAVLFFLW